ncbi:alpha/beta hydrolase [Enterococcus faecium]|nr:alpha/beta hydrolase [Enterococcus faecium]
MLKAFVFLPESSVIFIMHGYGYSLYFAQVFAKIF